MPFKHIPLVETLLMIVFSAIALFGLLKLCCLVLEWALQIS